MPAPLHEDARLKLTAYSPRDREQRRLRDDYLAHLNSFPDGYLRSCLPDHLTASALVVDPVRGRVLLGLHAKVKLWLQMGGHIEAEDEGIAEAALREAIEESGLRDLRLVMGQPLRLDRHPAPCSPAARYHLDLQFVAIAMSDAPGIISPEQLDLLWCPYDELPEPTDRGVRLLVQAAKVFLAV